MTTKTMRVYPDDEQRTRMLATLHNQSGAEFYHRILDFWVEHNQTAANELFAKVQHAVLSNDREQLRAVFRESVSARVDEDMRYLEQVGRSPADPSD
jgi:hypothetical protein